MNENKNRQHAQCVRAFRRGLSNLKVKDVDAVRAEIMEVLGVTTRQSFLRYANGDAVRLDIDAARRIEEIFARRGVRDCWGD